MSSDFYSSTGFANFTPGHFVMLLAGCLLIYLAVKKHYEPMILIPLGFGILIANIPLPTGSELLSKAFLTGRSGPLTAMDYLSLGVIRGYYLPLIFLGVGATADFSSILANPRLIFLGAAAQVGIFATLAMALGLDMPVREAACAAMLGGADGPTALFMTGRMAPWLIAPIGVAVYVFMALVPLIQPPIINALTTRDERLIRMNASRSPSIAERIALPVVAFLICALIAPQVLILLGMLFLGVLLKESGVTDRLSNTARSALLDTVTVLVGVGVGACASAQVMLAAQSMKIMLLGAAGFVLATAFGILFAKLMNLFSKEKINPVIGAAGVSALPNSARVAQMVCAKEDPTNFVLAHAYAPNVAGLIGSTVAAGVLMALLSR